VKINSYSAGVRRKFVFLVESHFQERDSKRFGVPNLLLAGFIVEIWQVFGTFRREYKRIYNPPDPEKSLVIKDLSDRNRFCTELQGLGCDDILMILIGRSYTNHFIYRQIAINKIFYGVIMSSSFPLLLNNKRNYGLRWLKEAIYSRVPNRFKRISQPNFALVCGGSNLNFKVQNQANCTAIWSHCLDYDIVLEIGISGNPQKREHIVFLDEYVPFHPDYICEGRKPPTTANEYYPKLRKLFEKIEIEFSQPVIIAAHPRSNYGSDQDFFGKRRIVRGETARLVKNASLVITHSSTSNSFTAIYQKPLLVITSNDLDRSIDGGWIRATADQFHAPLVNIDCIPDSFSKNEFNVKESVYTELVEKYFKKEGTEQLNSWQILIKHISSL
jgi:hypothetical protein